MKKIYWAVVWKWDKKLALFLGCFLLGQAFFSYKQIETLPFFNYGMYARPINPAPSIYTHYQLYQETQPVLLQKYPTSTFLEYQLKFYVQLKSQKPIDAPLKNTIHKRFAAFPSFEDYLVSHLSNPPSTLLDVEQWLEKKTSKNKLSIWKENYVWVKDSFKLLTKTLVL